MVSGGRGVNDSGLVGDDSSRIFRRVETELAAWVRILTLSSIIECCYSFTPYFCS